MKRVIVLLTAVVFGYSAANAQLKLVTRTGNATIFSHTPAEDISASNTTVTGLINATSGDVSVSVPVQGFRFEKSLMQEHFNNAQFMDSKQFPRIVLKGKITNISSIDLSKDGTYNVEISGDLTIKGVTKPVTEKAHIVVANGQVTVHAKFSVRDIGSYGVGKPKGSKKDNVANDIEVTYSAVYASENS